MIPTAGGIIEAGFVPFTIANLSPKPCWNRLVSCLHEKTPYRLSDYFSEALPPDSVTKGALSFEG